MFYLQIIYYFHSCDATVHAKTFLNLSVDFFCWIFSVYICVLLYLYFFLCVLCTVTFLSFMNNFRPGSTIHISTLLYGLQKNTHPFVVTVFCFLFLFIVGLACSNAIWFCWQNTLFTKFIWKGISFVWIIFANITTTTSSKCSEVRRRVVRIRFGVIYNIKTINTIYGNANLNLCPKWLVALECIGTEVLFAIEMSTHVFAFYKIY